MKNNFFTAPNLNKIPWIKHGFFTRNGGSSAGLYKTLNCSFASSDKKQNVLKNRNMILNFLKIQKFPLFIPNQVHGTKVEIISDRNSIIATKADALITSQKQIALGILTADCAPLLIVDRKKKIIATIHCGWKGTLNGIIENAIDRFTEMGSIKKNLIAAIGPCISSKSYEVKYDFVSNFKIIEKDIEDFFIFQKENTLFFDLNLYIKTKLLNNGLRDIFTLDIDTYANEKNFFSYRRSTHKRELDYGRQLTILSIIN